MASIQGHGLKPHLAPTPKEQPAAPAAEGQFAGKSVTVGSGGLTTGQRVALGIVTLGISELVIRLKERGSPEVVPTTGPGRAAQALNLTHAEAPDQEKAVARAPINSVAKEVVAFSNRRLAGKPEQQVMREMGDKISGLSNTELLKHYRTT